MQKNQSLGYLNQSAVKKCVNKSDTLEFPSLTFIPQKPIFLQSPFLNQQLITSLKKGFLMSFF